MLDLVFQNFTKSKSLTKDFFARILETGVGELGFKDKNLGISINLVGERLIRELNKKYRNKDKPTDVLSFPMSGNIQKSLSAYGLTSLPADLGDIFICLSIAKKEAKSENISIERKLAQLTVHGFLHLMGYDHELSPKDETEMLRLEDKILNKLLIK